VTRPTILVIDDHGGFRATARRLLEHDGWSVIGEAVDGETGLAAAASLAPDVVLLDIGLPDVDGFVVADFRASVGAPVHLKVVLRARLSVSQRTPWPARQPVSGPCATSSRQLKPPDP